MAGLPPDVAGVDLEEALNALGEVSGKKVGEEVLANIFRRFCLGK